MEEKKQKLLREQNNKKNRTERSIWILFFWCVSATVPTSCFILFLYQEDKI